MIVEGASAKHSFTNVTSSNTQHSVRKNKGTRKIVLVRDQKVVVNMCRVNMKYMYCKHIVNCDDFEHFL